MPGPEGLPPASAHILEPLRHGYNETSGKPLSQGEFLHLSMRVAALSMIRIPAFENASGAVIAELGMHTHKMTEKVQRMVAVYKAGPCL